MPATLYMQASISSLEILLLCEHYLKTVDNKLLTSLLDWQMDGGINRQTKITLVLAVTLHLRYVARVNDEKEACLQGVTGTKTYWQYIDQLQQKTQVTHSVHVTCMQGTRLQLGGVVTL